jgi:ATPase subunit of ABC transporter with duplicated ATPase domains
LLKIMAGIDKEIEGEAIPMAGLKIGYLPQEPVMDPEQTVREAVESGMGEVKAAQARLCYLSRWNDWREDWNVGRTSRTLRCFSRSSRA